jgi:hypothetical protein
LYEVPDAQRAGFFVACIAENKGRVETPHLQKQAMQILKIKMAPGSRAIDGVSPAISLLLL